MHQFPIQPPQLMPGVVPSGAKAAIAMDADCSGPSYDYARMMVGGSIWKCTRLPDPVPVNAGDAGRVSRFRGGNQHRDDPRMDHAEQFRHGGRVHQKQDYGAYRGD